MPTIDLTGQYLGQAIPSAVAAINQIFDPRQRIAIDQARMERELFPLKMSNLSGQTDLNAARALTEGARQGLFGAQTADQQAITGFRTQLGNGGQGVQPMMPPQVSPLIEPAVQQFNSALQATPGAPPPVVMQPGAMSQAGIPGYAPPSPEAPNPLLPPAAAPAPPQQQVQGYDPMRMAALAAAVNKNPNPSAVVESLARGEALNGGFDESRSREIALAQGLLPNVNTAVTPERQGQIIDNKNAQGTSINNADNAAAMERTQAQQQGAGQRTVLGATLKAMYGKDSDQAVKYSDQRKMSADAGEMADRVFQINRDEGGAPSSAFDAKLTPEVMAQRDQLSRRITGHLMAGKDVGTARDLALTELFGSPNTGDPQFYTQGADPLFGWNRPFSAKQVNATALGTVDRTASESMNGASPAAAAMLQGILGIGAPQAQPTAQPAAPAPAAPAKPAPKKDDPYAMRPSNAEVAKGKSNKAYADMLRAEVASIEQQIQSGQQANTSISPISGIWNALTGGKPTDLNKDNDARNALVQKRAALLAEIAKLDPQPVQSAGNPSEIDDIANKY